LVEFEKSCIAERKFKDAELASKRIEELRLQEIEYRTVMTKEKSKLENEELENLTSHQLEEFNRLWDQLIQEHLEQIKIIEQEMVNAHEEESLKYDQEVSRLVAPKPKFTTDVLNMRHLLEKLIQAKRYSEAEAISKKLENLEKKETEKWEIQFREKFIKKKQLLYNRQKIELSALQEKLQNSFQEKLRMRSSELRKLLHRFQNMKNELELKQSHEISKLNLLNEKVNKSGNFTAFKTKNHNNSLSSISKIENSKIGDQSQSHIDN